MAIAEQDQLSPPVTVPWDFYVYETPEVVLWRLGPRVSRVAEVLNWKNKVLWRSKGYGDVSWAFQDSAGHEIGEGFYRVRVQESGKVHWASMNVHWKQHISIVENEGRNVVLLAAGPDKGTGFTVTVTNKDSLAWELNYLAWSDGTTEAFPIPIEVTNADSVLENSVVLLPNQANAYRIRFISTKPVFLDSLRFDIITNAIGLPNDSSTKP